MSRTAFSRSIWRRVATLREIEKPNVEAARRWLEERYPGCVIRESSYRVGPKRSTARRHAVRAYVPEAVDGEYQVMLTPPGGLGEWVHSVRAMDWTQPCPRCGAEPGEVCVPTDKPGGSV